MMTKVDGGDCRSEFRARMKEARERRGLTQLALALKAKLQPAAINHFESGRRVPSLENLGKLADALEVTADYLLGRQTPDEMFRDRREQLSPKSRDLLDDFVTVLENRDKQEKWLCPAQESTS